MFEPERASVMITNLTGVSISLEKELVILDATFWSPGFLPGGTCARSAEVGGSGLTFLT